VRRLDTGALVAGLAFVAYVALAASLARLEWLDAWTASWFEVLRGCEGHRIVRTLSDASPWISLAALALAVVLAVRRGLAPREIVLPLVLLGIGLLEVQALKVICERDRPGIPPWQVSSGHAFPSSHVTGAALLAVTAVILFCRGARGRGRWIAATALGATYVLAVAATRLYLGRHWATDVVGAVLLGIAFAGVVAARPPAAPRLVGALVGLQLLGVFMAVEAGGRIHLPAPTMLAEAGDDGPAPLRGYRLARVLDGNASVPKKAERGGRIVALADGEATIDVPAGLVRPAVMKLVAFPHAPAAASACAWVDVSVDGTPIARRALKRRWRALAFALPAFAPGPRVVRLRFDPPAVRLRALSLETRAGGIAMARSRERPGDELVQSAAGISSRQ
jgi:undecaprenyl-diphosphatase